mgnify:CR=1 FL=1
MNWRKRPLNWLNSSIALKLNYFYPKIYREINKIVDYEDRLHAQEKEFGYNALEVSALLHRRF